MDITEQACFTHEITVTLYNDFSFKKVHFKINLLGMSEFFMKNVDPFDHLFVEKCAFVEKCQLSM